MVDVLNQRICCPIAISELLHRTNGYLRVSSSSLETDIITFTFNIYIYKHFFQYVLLLHLADEGFD